MIRVIYCDTCDILCCVSGEVCINVIIGLSAVLVLVLVIVPGILFVLVKKRYIIIQRNRGTFQ